MPSRIERVVTTLGLAGCLMSALADRASADVPLRTLILTGEGGPGWRTSTPALRRILEDSGRFEVRVCESPAGLSARTLEGFDLLVDNGAGLTRGGNTEKAVAAFVASGKGLVVARGGAGVGDAPTFWPVSTEKWPDRPAGFLDVTIARPDHPIVAGMKPRFRTADALPSGLTAHTDSETIATAVVAQGDGEGQGRPVLVASRSGGGRVVALGLGHDPSAIHEPQFVATFARASEWAATGIVTLRAVPRPIRPAPGAVRGLVITGGHDHEAAFYSLFDDQPDLDRLPVDTSANAFKKDLMDQYDVIIMYDFSRDLDEPCRKNLRAFVEDGKGVVVLHHALLNYQDWAWWSEEVVGGRYRLKREGSAPSSAVKNDQEIYVSPAAAHPILDGLAPFHITDEAYKGLYMSPDIRPLLTTDNPTSDTNLAWVGPCRTSRVVAIQLGHGHSAFGHPSYRALVHNAVLWAAGKLK